MKHRPPEFPRHILDLVDALDQLVKAATAPGVRDEEGETYSLEEDGIEEQLRLLGWGALLDERTGRWVPAPPDLTILHNWPDPLYYLQRCYQVPEYPARWEFLYDGDDKRHFETWEDAYAFLFVYTAQEQGQLPLRRYRVRAPGGWGGYDYAARTPEQALILHRNDCIRVFHFSPYRATHLDLSVFEHSGDRGFYCSACAFAPCSYIPSEKWPMPASPGSLVFPTTDSPAVRKVGG